LQWQFANTWVADVGYQGASSKKLVATRGIGNGGNGLGLARDANGNLLDNVKATENRASSTYNSLQARLEKRLSAGLVMINSYTWSHTIDETAGDFGAIADARGSFGGPQNPLRADLEKGNSSFDIRHKFTSSVVYDLPFGEGRRFINTGGSIDRIVSGFQVNFITTWHSGLPYSVTCGSFSPPGGGNLCDGGRRPDLIGDPNANVPDGLDFNPLAFGPPSQRVTNLAGKEIIYGGAGRNILRGPQRFNLDASLFKNTAITENVKLQLGLEFFNLLNNVQKVVPNNSLNFNPDGTINFDNRPGTLNNAYPQRQGQIRAKIIF
jgi:hypothetical protein